MSNLARFGITLKDAKAICREKIGRLPKPGREVFIMTQRIGGMSVDIHLQSIAGKLELRSYTHY